MLKRRCRSCGAVVLRKPACIPKSGRVYCSVACAAHTRFQAGHRTWNKNKKGIHLSPHSEFKPGRSSPARAQTGAERTRRDKGGHDRVWVKVGQPREWRERARVVWETAHGSVPRGRVLHHHDRDTTNDAIRNLRLLTRAQHAAEHRDQLSAWRKR